MGAAELVEAYRLLPPEERTLVRAQLDATDAAAARLAQLAARGLVRLPTEPLGPIEPITVDVPKPISKLLQDERR